MTNSSRKKRPLPIAVSVEAISRRKLQLGASLIALKKFYPLRQRASNMEEVTQRRLGLDRAHRLAAHL